MNKKDLQRRFRQAEREAQDILAAVDKAGRPMNLEERRQLDTLTSELEKIQADLDELVVRERGGGSARDLAGWRQIQAQQRADAHLDPFADPSDPTDHSGNGDAAGGPLVRSRKWAELARRSGVVAAGREGWRDASEYFQVLASGRHDPRLTQRASSTLIDSEGGFAVPQFLAEQIFDAALESEIVRPRAAIYAMAGQTLSVPVWDGDDHSGGELHGGFGAQWVAEQGSFDISTPNLRRTTFQARKFGLLCKVSSELASDSPAFSSALLTAMSKAASFHLDRAFLVGAGGAGPVGVLNSPALVAVAKETGQTNGTIVYSNILKMWSRLAPGSFEKAVWVTSQTALPQLLNLSVAIGTGGSHVPAVLQQNGTFTLMGRPLLVSEKVPVLGAQGDLLLADFSQYAVAIRADVRIETSGAPYFTSDELAVRLKIRIDGKSMAASPITPMGGGDTLSPFVAIAART